MYRVSVPVLWQAAKPYAMLQGYISASGIQYDGGLMHVSMLMEGILNISCEKEIYVVCWYVLLFLYFPSFSVLRRVGENRFYHGIKAFLDTCSYNIISSSKCE
jgi:hypothetical protein